MTVWNVCGTNTKSMQNSNHSAKIAVIGAGAAGLLAAGTAAEAGADVTLFDSNEKPGRKLMITGKGRCNVTNNCTVPEFLENVRRNPRFLYAALSAFPPEKTISFFESLGVPLKTERGRRVFPVSDKAADIVDALKKYTKNVTYKHEKVKKLIINDGRIREVLIDKPYAFDAVILATGGLSYPLTGSDGSGYRLAENAGHTLADCRPSLVPLTSPDPLCRELQGLSLRNIDFSVRNKNGKEIYRDFGEMMFTHFGITGPVVLSASAHLVDCTVSDYHAVIDLKPALDEQRLDHRLLSDFEKYKNKDFANALSDLLPQKLIAPMIRLSGIDPHKKVNAVTKAERRSLLSHMKGLTVSLSGTRPVSEAIVTAGGIHVKEVDPKTMMSKICPGLFFAGEVLDVDAYTGGYNLQIAFSTGYLAAESAVRYVGKETL